MINVYHNIPANMRPFRRTGLPVTATKTYELRAPVSTHFRRATCAEMECQPHLHGWATTVLPGSDDEATLLRAVDGQIDGMRRRFAKHPEPGGFVRYIFPAGQACFAASRHVKTLDREPLYVVRGGDWRANTGLIRRHVHGDDWVDDFATNQDAVATRIERG